MYSFTGQKMGQSGVELRAYLDQARMAEVMGMQQECLEYTE